MGKEETNKYLERINRFYREYIQNALIIQKGECFYYLDPKTTKYEQLRIYKSGQTKLKDSTGLALYTSHIRFMLNNPGPYSLEQLVLLMFNKEFNKYFGWVEGFWNERTRVMYFNLLLQNEVSLHEHFIKDNHTRFYKSIQNSYQVKQKYRSFLIDMGQDPDEINARDSINFFLQQGLNIEVAIVNILKEIGAPFEYFKNFNCGNPDIFRKETNEVTDIKRSIKTKIDKEILKYSKEFEFVTVIYLLGSRQTDKIIQGVRKVSVFRWIREQDFFKSLGDNLQGMVLNSLETLAETISTRNAIADRKDYHKKLVEQIISFEKKGLNNPEIAKEIGTISYKYVNMILLGKALKEYSGDYPEVYKVKVQQKKENLELEKNEVLRLALEKKLTTIEIADSIGISADMVKYYLRQAGLNSKVNIEKRNAAITDLLNSKTDLGTKENKFYWIIDCLKDDFPHLKFGAIKNFYYQYYKSSNGSL